jgi:hypothetical protein
VFEDLLSFLIPATGSFTVAGTTVAYKFAADIAASIHAGFAIGALLLLKTPLLGILSQLITRVPAGSNIYIAGHSQGAAVSCLLNSYLYYAAQSLPAYSYKTYSFAQPKPGNDHYETDFGSLFGNKGLAFRLTNSLDFIPQLPFTWELPTDLNIKIPLTNPPVAGGLDGLTPTVPPRLRGLASFESLNAVRSQTIQSVYETSKVRLQERARAVAQTQNPYVAAGPFTIPFVDSLYFVAAATEMALIGTPCATPAQCKDLLWQHHTTTYYSLMQAQLGS